MNFEQFRKDFEDNFPPDYKMELLEFHFLPFSFGNGILAYRIEGTIHKFLFGGRDNHLSWLVSPKHQKYGVENFSTFKSFVGLDHVAEIIQCI